MGHYIQLIIKNNNVKWVTNLNQSIDINPSNLFNGHELVSNEDYVIVSSVDATYIISSINGAILRKIQHCFKNKASYYKKSSFFSFFK